MPLTKDWILRKFETVDVQKNIKDDVLMIQCPFHGEGQERTPSCKLNLTTTTGYPVGSFFCYGCGRQDNSFKPIADAFNIEYVQDPDDNFSLMISHQRTREMLSEDAFAVDQTYQHFPRWDAQVDFRGMYGKLVHKLGARKIETDYGTRAYFPVFMQKREIGGITATLEKNKYGPSYIYTQGKWIRKALFPYDYTARLLKKHKKQKKKKVLLLGEGTRDALNPLGVGIPSLMNFGGITTWSKKKADYILALEPDLVILGFDPDEIGQKITEVAYNNLHNSVPTIELDLPVSKNKDDKLDLGALSQAQLKKLKHKLYT